MSDPDMKAIVDLLKEMRDSLRNIEKFTPARKIEPLDAVFAIRPSDELRVPSKKESIV